MSHLVELYEPPPYSLKSVGGESVDAILTGVRRALGQLEAEGVTVQRYQFAAQPASFLKNAEIAALMQSPEGLNSLPVTIVNGTVIKRGGYPTLAELQGALS